MRIWLFCSALIACGGIIDTGDGGGSTGGPDSGNGGSDGATKKDVVTVDVSKPPPPTCTQIQSQTTIDSNGGCESSASWSCGDTKYSVQCDCPSTQCTCSQESNGTGTGTLLKEPSFCPACNAAEMPKLCGFPTN